MIEIPKVTDVEIAFGSTEHLPKWENIPDEFKVNYPEHPGVTMAAQWFYGTLAGAKLPPVREGVNEIEAMRVIRAILVSFEPKHEHKMAGVGYLINEWWDLEKVNN